MFRTDARSVTKVSVSADRKHIPSQTEASLFRRVFRRRPQPTTFQRCLAVHMHFAQPERGTYAR
jgi:hypothetical protein